MQQREDFYTNCDWCDKDIAYGNASVTINRNIEQMDSTEEDPEGVATVIDSDVLLTLCAQCGNKLNTEMLKEMLLALKRR